jgi:hypothetical protein
MDGFDWTVLLALAALSLWLLALVVREQTTDHLWIGAEGTRLPDQMQFLGWVRDAGDGGLIGNLFQVPAGDGVYLHPGFAFSGAMERAGLPVGLAYLVWKPVAVLAIFFAVRGYVRRVLTTVVQRRAALVLALFYVAPFAAVAAAAGRDANARDLDAVTFETWPGRFLWGYPFTAISIAALIGALLLYERDRRDPRVRFTAPVLGLACAWFQPWAGVTLIGIVVISELLWTRRQRGNLGLLLATVIFTGPLVAYYAYLSRTDGSWERAADANAGDLFEWWILVVSLVALALPAALAYRRPPRTFQQVAVRVWPVVAIVTYVALGVADEPLPGHALQGVTIPLAVLAVAGAATIRKRARRPVTLAAVAIAVLVLIAPGAAREFEHARDAVEQPAGPMFLRDAERDAMTYLDEHDDPGGVLAPVFVGQAVPALTGRETWVGHPSWTSDYQLRVAIAESLFSGAFAPGTAQQIVLDSGVRFLFSDCAHRRVDLSASLQPILAGAQRFGCSVVYELRVGDGEDNG